MKKTQLILIIIICFNLVACSVTKMRNGQKEEATAETIHQRHMRLFEMMDRRAELFERDFEKRKKKNGIN